MSYDSKYISKFYDANLSDSPPWIALQYFAGTTVLEEVAENGPLDEKKWFECAHDILSALSYVHAQDDVHRDINPNNVMLVYGGARLIDFGIARIQGADQSSTHFYGASGYTSPEHYTEKASPKNDIFVAATLLTYAGSGKLPWKADTQDRFEGSIFTDSPRYTNLSENQKMLLKEMHQKNSKTRPSADQSLAILSEILAESPITKSQQIKRVKTFVPRPDINYEDTPSGFKVSIKNSENKKPSQSMSSIFVKENRGLIILTLFTGGWGLLLYWLIKRFAKSGVISKKYTLMLATSSAISAASYGGLLFIPGFYWSKKLADRKLFWTAFKTTFLVFPALVALIANYADEAKNPGGEVPTWVALYLGGVFFVTYRIHRRIYRTIATGEIPPEKTKKIKTKKEIIPGSKDVSDNIEKPLEPILNITTDSRFTTADKSWELVESAIFSNLSGRKGKQFTIDVISNKFEGVYFQGYSEPGGYITVEAAANQSVIPNLEIANRKGLIKIGWEPPSDGLPNYIKFLDLKESENSEVAKLLVETIRSGYLLEIGSFKISM